MDILSLSLQSFFNSRVGSFIEIFIYDFSGRSESIYFSIQKLLNW